MSQDIVQEIKLRIDLVELISAYVPLRQSGRTFKGSCPFHNEKTPSFHVDRERGVFKCFGCGVGGDCFTFLQQREGLSFQEAAETLARRVGLEWIRKGESREARSLRERLYDVNTLVERFFRESLKNAPEVLQYLRTRGLTDDIIEEFGLGYAPPGYESLLSWLKRARVSFEDAAQADVLLQGEYGWRDRFVDRVMFPIYDVEGRPVAFGGRTLQADRIPKYLNTKETPIFQKGRTLYGLHRAKQAIPAAGFSVAVEGYMDVIALHQAGIDNSVASLGTAVTETHVHVLRRYSDRLVMCYDGDGAGMQAAVRNSAMFEAAGCEVRVARLPAGEDPDTFIKQQGADAFRAILNRAEPLLDYQLNELRSRYNLTDEGARLEFVRDAARTIAQSGSFLIRQEYATRLTRLLDRLADEWYPGDPHRAIQARIALSQEVNRLLRTDRVSAAARPSPPRAHRPAPADGMVQAERYVLRAALTEPHWAARVAARLTPAHLQSEELAGIASALLGNNESGVQPPTSDATYVGGSAGISERITAVHADPGFAGIVSDLLLDQAPLSEEGLEACLNRIERAWKERRLRELSSAHVAQPFPPGDPRGEELRRLRLELGGRQRRED